MVDHGFRLLNFVHRSIIHASRGRVGTSAFGMVVVEIRVTGRRTGLTRSTILTAPVCEEGRVVLVASKGGDDRDPQWFLNLLAKPSVDVVVKGKVIAMSARVATEHEASTLWPQIIATYHPYATYRRRSSREIPLVICEPR